VYLYCVSVLLCGSAVADNSFLAKSSTQGNARPPSVDRDSQKEEARRQGSYGVVDARTNFASKSTDNFSRLLSTIGVPATMHTLIRSGAVQFKAVTLSSSQGSSQLTIEGHGIKVPMIEMSEIASIRAGKGTSLQSVTTLKEQRMFTIILKDGTEFNCEVDSAELRDAAVTGLLSIVESRRK
jgi:hypothetical protein